VSAPAALAALAAAAGVLGAWEALAAVERARAWRALLRALAPLRRAEREGREPTLPERRRLALLGAGALCAGGWLLAGAAGALLAGCAGPWLAARAVRSRQRRWRARVAREAPVVALALADALDGGHAVGAAVATLVAETVSRLGRLDILVNNASARREVPFPQLDYREWRDILGVTLDGAYLCCHAALPHLMLSGHGTIVNIGGLSSFTGAADRAHVIAAKAGLAGLTRALAHDLAPHGITVNTVAPGVIDTVRRGADGHGPGKEPAHHAVHVPLTGRKGRPEEVAALVRFLCGPGSRYLTGQTIHANGGVFMA